MHPIMNQHRPKSRSTHLLRATGEGLRDDCGEDALNGVSWKLLNSSGDEVGDAWCCRLQAELRGLHKILERLGGIECTCGNVCAFL